MASTPSRTCPACGARNSDRSLFCAECGASLASDSGAWNDSDATQTFEPIRDNATWERPMVDEQRPPGNGHAAATSPAPPPYATFDQGWGGAPVAPPESSRGFWLGVIAWILILAVVGMYVWAGVLGDQLKDDIRDIVPGLAQVIVRP